MSITEKILLLKSRAGKEVASQMTTSTATAILDKIKAYFKIPVAGRAKEGVLDNLNRNDIEFITTVRDMIGAAPVVFQDTPALVPTAIIIGGYCSGNSFRLIVLDTATGVTTDISAIGSYYYGYQCSQS